MTAQSKIEAATLSSAMALAFAEIEAATKAVTGQVGQQKYKYADLGAVIEAIKPALISHGLFFTQRCHPDHEGVSVETVLHHAGGQECSLGTLYVPANKRDAQGFGSALTYARRYGLMTAFGVPAEDDDGNAAVKSSPRADPAPTSDRPTPDRKTQNRDAPFPPGPAKNKTELKAKGRDLWADVMACEDASALDALLATNAELIKQLKEALPQWWGGGTNENGAYEGLGQVIERLQRDFAGVAENGMDWRGNPVLAG